MHAPLTELVTPAEETLDPDDWDGLRILGHRMVDDVVEYLRTVRDRPAWRPIPEHVRRALDGPVPLNGVGAERAYHEFVERVLQYPLGNIHPRFWGWVTGTGTAFGTLAEMLCAAMNVNVSGSQSAPMLVEELVLRWLAEMLGFPTDASGVLVSGGSMANFVGIAAGLHARAGADVGAVGFVGATRRPMVYASHEAHFSIGRAVRLLGLGNASLRMIAADADYKIDFDALEHMIAADRATGATPALVVGNAGTVRTGAFDDLDRLAEMARRERLWLHVDGAFGALAALAPGLAALTVGMERADSLAIDLHKWLHVPIDAGCVLVRDATAHRAAFGVAGSYIGDLGAGVAISTNRFTDLGIQQSRSARGVKVWLSLKEHGVQAFGRMIEKNVDQARYLTSLVHAADRLELLAPVPLNIVCFRYRRAGLTDEVLDDLNRRILIALQERGIAVPSHALIGERFALRCAITNHRSRAEDFEVLARAVVDIGDELAAAS